MNTISPSTTALLVIDMQNDYCSGGFYMDKAGYDTSRLRWPIAPIIKLIEICRSSEIPVIFTRQYRVEKAGVNAHNDNYPNTALKGEKGWEIIPELTPLPNELVFDKTTSSAFMSTDLDRVLKEKGISTLIFCGNTIDVCVHSTLRSADDLGYKCITVADGCGAANDELHKWSLESIMVEGGVFGDVIESGDLRSLIQ